MTPSSSPRNSNRRATPPNPASAAGGVGERDAELGGEGGGGDRVHRVVATGYRQRERAELDPATRHHEAAAVATTRPVDDPVVGRLGEAERREAGARGERRGERVVGGRDPWSRHRGDEVVERAHEALERPVVVEVVGFDVRDDGGLGRELEERAVALVGFHDHPLAVVVRGVRADFVEIAADDERRSPARRAQDQRQHRRRRRLAVTARDRDPAPCGDDGPQRIGASVNGDPPVAGRHDFRVRRRDRGRDHDRVDVVGHVLGSVTDDRVDLGGAQPLERGATT